MIYNYHKHHTLHILTPINYLRRWRVGGRRSLREFLLLLCLVRDINKSWRECLGPNQAQLITMHRKNFQKSFVVSKSSLSEGCLTVLPLTYHKQDLV